MNSLVFEMQKGSGIPAGHYTGEFTRAEIVDDNADKYGRGIRLVWKVASGEQDGNETNRICSAKLSPKSNLYKFAMALNGGPLEAGEKFDLEKFYGTKGMVIVEPCGDDGSSTRVASFLKS